MKLKKLELIGFKSFADKASFDFEGDFTGLVGPNGSGKSNVVDALKWVLGEQSAKSLRGNEMSDMIFNGSGSRRAQGSAEVRITLDNSAGMLPVDYEEVCISRCCFRSGESKYSLNGKNCRLKEIRNLLLDTGVGVNAYSIIEQGQIDMLLQASSKERRAVLEEAAGINRYLEQKKEAERKLERVKGNLQRVTDIIEELEKQLRSVRRHASKARRYKRHKSRHMRLRLAIALNEKAHLLKRRRKIASLLEKAQEKEQNLTIEMETVRSETANKQEKVEQCRSELASKEEEISRSDARIYSLKKEKDLNIKRKSELHQRTQNLIQRQERLKGSKNSIKKELREAEKELLEGRENLEKTQNRIEAVKGDLNNALEEKISVEEFVDEEKNSVFELMQLQSQVQNQLNMLGSEVNTLVNRLRRNQERKQGLKQKHQELENKYQTETNRLQEVKNELSEVNKEAGVIEDKLSKTRIEFDELTADIGDLKAELQGKIGRKQVLEDLQARADGVGSGVKLLLDEMNTETSPLSDAYGMLGNIINVSTEYARAIESALGPYVQAIVVNTRKQAAYALELVRDKGKGRVYMAALENIKQAGTLTDNGQVTSEKGYSNLIELIDCPRDIGPVLDSLIGDSCLFEEGGEGNGSDIDAPAHLRLVKRNGDIFDSNGIWSAGEPESGGLISRRSELAELEVEIRTINERLSDLSDAAERCSLAMESLQTSQRELRVRKESLQKSESEIENRISVLESQKHQTCEEITVLSEDAQALNMEKEEAEAQIKSKREEAQALVSKKEASESRHNETQQQLKRLQQKCDSFKEHKNKLENQVSRLEEKQNGHDMLIKRLKNQLEQSEQEIERVMEERRSCNLEIEKTVESIEKSGAEISRLTEGLVLLKEKAAGKRRIIEKFKEELEAARTRSDNIEKHLKGAQKEFQNNQMEANETKIKLENLAERTAEECGVNLDAMELTPECWREHPLYADAQIEEFYVKPGNVAASEQVAAWYIEEKKEEIQKNNENNDAPTLIKLKEAVDLQKDVFEIVQSPGADWEELRREAKEVKGKLERIGGANLDAIREQDQLEIRAEFLTNQREDLEKARRHELELIRQLSKESRAKFTSTFENVRQNFQVIIRKLFGGGNGDLQLEGEAEDVLEAGIEITVRPPGKETRSISLLSGGEKALSAVALLFAIFESKPSPFCLLDEVDAPLDEANVGRFLGLLEQYTENTQFIIVTHNKLTMSAAETLYGISMNEDGTSRKVAVNFEEVDLRLKEMEQETERAKAG